MSKNVLLETNREPGYYLNDPRMVLEIGVDLVNVLKYHQNLFLHYCNQSKLDCLLSSSWVLYFNLMEGVLRKYKKDSIPSYELKIARDFFKGQIELKKKMSRYQDDVNKGVFDSNPVCIDPSAKHSIEEVSDQDMKAFHKYERLNIEHALKVATVSTKKLFLILVLVLV